MAVQNNDTNGKPFQPHQADKHFVSDNSHLSNAPPRNLHLSDVIATIQDDGPAVPKQPRPRSGAPDRPETAPPPVRPTPPSSQAENHDIGRLPDMPRSLIWSLFAVLLALVLWNVFTLQHLQTELANVASTVAQSRNSNQTKRNDLTGLEQTLSRLAERTAKLEAGLTSTQQFEPRFQQALAELQQTVAQLAQQLASTKMATTAPDTANAPANWYVNVAVLSDHQAAQRLKDKIKSLGAEATVQPLQSANKKLYRIRVYGFVDQATAEREAQRLQTALSLNGLWVAK